MIQKTKSQFEKQIDELRQKVASSGTGTGVFLDDAHTSVAHNDTENNVSTCLYDSIDGYKNSSTWTLATPSISPSPYDIVNFGTNTITGQHNTLIDGNSAFMYGIRNRGERISQAKIGGLDNTAYQVTYSDINGQDNDISNAAFSAVYGHQITVNGLLCGLAIGRGHNIAHNNYASSAGMAVFGDGATVVTSDRYKIVVGHSGNIFTVDESGNVAASGTITPSGADYAEYFEWADGNPENEDRRGMLVTLDGDKIVPANGDDILGVISGCASVIGNAYDLHWCGKYATDVYGSIITTPKGERIVSLDYDPNREYIPRSKRPEWSPVGLIGRIIVRDNGECKVGEFICGDNGYAFPCLVGKTNIRCLKRVDETHIEVLIK